MSGIVKNNKRNLAHVTNFMRPALRDLLGNREEVETRTLTLPFHPTFGETFLMEDLMAAAAAEGLEITRRLDSGQFIYTIRCKSPVSSTGASSASVPVPVKATPVTAPPATPTPTGPLARYEQIKALAATAPPKPERVVIAPPPTASVPVVTKPHEPPLDPEHVAAEARHLQVTLRKARVDISTTEAVRVVMARERGTLADPSTVAYLSRAYQIEMGERGVEISNMDAIRHVVEKFQRADR